MHTTNYFDTFIEVAEDCPAQAAEIPQKREKPTAAEHQFETIYKNPYRFTSDEVLFDLYAQKNQIPENELKTAHKQFFSKGQACLRSSPLVRHYGWGIHCNGEGKVAICPIGSSEYELLTNDPNVKQVKGMRSSRKQIEH